MNPRASVHTVVALLVAVPVLWALLPPAASGNEFLQGAGGGLTIGGPGEYIGKADDPDFLIHESESERTLCVTLEGKMGTTIAEMDGLPQLAVVADEEQSVCREEMKTVELRCDSGDCEARWRVDTIRPVVQGPTGATGPTGVDGADGEG